LVDLAALAQYLLLRLDSSSYALGSSQPGARVVLDVRAFDALPISCFSRRSAGVVTPEACSWVHENFGGNKLFGLF
jgi:hypothetical protein